MRTLNKTVISVLLISGFLLFTGFDLFKDVELSYKDPLIDLYGNTSPENPLNFTEEVNKEKEEGVVTEEKKDPVPSAVTETKDRHIIGVKYKTITLDGRECTLDTLEETVKKKADRNTEILLWDNYAEYHTYLSVLNKLNELKGSKRFKLTEKALGEAP